MSVAYYEKIKKVLNKISENGSVPDAVEPAYPADLVEAYRTLTNGAEKELQPGMLAIWKPGLKNRKIPDYDEPAVVVGIEQGTISDENSSGSRYFKEPLDLKLGVFDRDVEFCVYHFDSRRFMPAPQ